LRRLRLEKLEPKFKVFDEQLRGNEITLTEHDIAELVSNDRKKDMGENWNLLAAKESGNVLISIPIFYFGHYLVQSIIVKFFHIVFSAA